jgi:ADP-heptose:LPS heptosyltransferase
MVMSDPLRRPLPQAPAVLVVLMGSLGDIARALPLVSILKQHRPEARLSWLVDWRWRDLIAAHPGVDRIITFPRERMPGAFSRLASDLRGSRPDVVLDLQRILKSGICSRVSGAPRRIGFHRGNTKEFNYFFNTEHIARRSPRLPKWRHYLAFAEHLELSVPDSLDFGLRQLADPDLLPDELRGIGTAFVTFVMGSSWPSKQWTEAGYRELIGIVERETPHRVALVGDPSQRAFAERVARLAASPRLVNLAGRTSLVELGATLAAARAAVGPDSGPGHLAAALGTPHVTLFGPTDPDRVAPYRCEHLTVRSPVDCAPCWRRRCRRRAGPCMDAITPAMVWQKLAPLLS